MAVAVPLIASFVAGGASIAGMGAALAGASGFAAFAGVAGGIMASVGMITGSKTLTKVGGILGLAGAVTGIASSLGSGAAEAAGSAAGDAASEAAKGAADGLAPSATEAVKSEIASNTLGQGFGQGAEQAATSGAGAPLQLDTGTANLMDQYRAGMVDGSDYGLTSRGLGTASAATDASQTSALGKLAEAGQQIKDKTALDTMLDKLNGAGQWIKNNKEVAMVGGQLLAGGMQSYQQGQQFDTQMNLLAQRRARLNNPVVLGIQPQLTVNRGG